MSIDDTAADGTPTSDLHYWQNLVREHPQAGNTIQYNADAPFEEYRKHNTILHMVVMNMYSLSPEMMQDVVSLLLQHGADPNIQNDDGETPLHVVCQTTMRDPSIAKLLLAQGADSSIKTNKGKLPIDMLGSDEDRYSREIRLLLQQSN
ncbi:MAG: ankyrin repeat domain-containing protein [Planctomycetales bacterium]|nr:ankyrin repeat domain-containing protein [Planctomycetales bacterium]